MTLFALSTVLLCLAQTPPEPGWERAAVTDGISVYSRASKGSSIREMKAVGTLDAPPPAVWKVLRDYNHYRQTLPYTEESRIVGSENGDKVIYFYSVITAPLVSRRDYLIRIVDESDWKDGQGFMKATWTASTKGPPPKAGIVRVTVNDGYWLLEPRDGGKKTLATYLVHTDPGGSIPAFIANSANGTAVPNVFKSLRKATLGKK